MTSTSYCPNCLDQGLSLIVYRFWVSFVSGGLIQPIRLDPLRLIFQKYLNSCKPKPIDVNLVIT